jgi:hypothetical protein
VCGEERGAGGEEEVGGGGSKRWWGGGLGKGGGLPADCIRHPVEEVRAKERGVDGEREIQASRG